MDLVPAVTDRLPALVLRTLLDMDEIDEKTVRRFGDMIQLLSTFTEPRDDLDKVFGPGLQALALLGEVIDERPPPAER